MKSSAKSLILVLCAAVFISSSVYIALTSSTTNGRLGIVESDQLLYMQYARNIAMGHPYVFTPGDAPSTGSTTHLYLYILAGIYALGATGHSFFTAIFILNALFFLGIMACVWLIARKLCPRMLPAAMFLSVISGHTLSAVFGQTDIGFFTLLALTMFTTLLYARYGWMLLLAFLCGLTRPEGFIFAVAFFLCGTGTLLLNRKQERGPGEPRQGLFFLLAGLAGALAFAITLCVNYGMTGHAQFMSVVSKGYFKTYPFFGAIEHTLFDAGTMIKGVFFGLSTTSREFFVFPILGGLLSLCGILLHPRQSKQIQLCEIWLALSLGAVIVTVASSEWQGISNDRYLGWIMPLWTIYMLIGIDELAQRFDTKRFKPVLIGLLCAYQLTSTAYFFSYAYSSGGYLEKSRNFCNQIRKALPDNATLGSLQGGALQYYLPHYRIYNLYGITSPAFSQPHFDIQLVRIIDMLKHEPNLRFDDWLMLSRDRKAQNWTKPFVGKLIAEDTDAAVTTAKIYCVYKADWDAIEGGDTPVLVKTKLAGKALIDRMDVGYQPDEKAHDYAEMLRFRNTHIPLTLLTTNLGTNQYADVGRIIMGQESFSVHHVQPDRPLKIVLRTAQKVEGETYFGRQKSQINGLQMSTTLNLRIFVDEQEVPCPPLNIGHKGFNEIIMSVPATYLHSANPRIKIAGDHISFDYWFYQ